MKTEYTRHQFYEKIKNTEYRIKTTQDEQMKEGLIKYKKLLEDARDLGHAIWLGGIIARKEENASK